VRAGSVATRSPRRAERDCSAASARERPSQRQDPRHPWPRGGPSHRVGAAGSRGHVCVACLSAMAAGLSRAALAPPALSPPRVLALAGRLGGEDGRPYQPASGPRWRDPRVFGPGAPRQNGGAAGGQKAPARLDPACRGGGCLVGRRGRRCALCRPLRSALCRRSAVLYAPPRRRRGACA
jgi:hypothetical protein